MKILSTFLLFCVFLHFTYADYVHHLQDDAVQKHVERIFGSKIKDSLEKLKEVMKTGNETLGVPKLDSFNSEFQEIEIDTKPAAIKGNVSDLEIEGLSDFTVQKADYEFFKSNLVIDLLWSNIRGNTLYNVNAMILDKYRVYGKGDVSFELQDLNFATKVNVRLDIVHKKVSIVKFSETKVSLKKLKVEITGLLNHEELSQHVGPIISYMAPDFLVYFQDEITSQLNTIMVELGNEILEKIDIWKFVDL